MIKFRITQITHSHANHAQSRTHNHAYLAYLAQSCIHDVHLAQLRTITQISQNNARTITQIMHARTRFYKAYQEAFGETSKKSQIQCALLFQTNLCKCICESNRPGTIIKLLLLLLLLPRWSLIPWQLYMKFAC